MVPEMWSWKYTTRNSRLHLETDGIDIGGEKMFKRLCNFWIRRKTKNLTRIPLFTMVFDYRKYKQDGKPGSCTFYAHPEIARDEFVKEKLCEVVDHIRDNYDLDIFTKI